MKPRLTPHQSATILAGISTLVAFLLIMQLWLLTATMNAWLGGDRSVVWPAAAASLACLGVNLWLLRRLQHLERREE